MTGRRRTRHQVTLSPETTKKLRGRVSASLAAGRRSSFSAEIERSVDEAEGNLRTARHDLANAMNPLRLQLHWLQTELHRGRRLTAADLQPIEDAVTKMAERIEPRAPTRENPSAG